MPVSINLHESTSGLGVLLEGDLPGPTVLLRGDMDALPMPEDTGLDFSSKVDGCMHACGHDTHTAMLVGAAKMLSARRSELAGRVLFMFQPGEEGYHGAKYMLDEGLLNVSPLSDGSASPVTGAYTLHISSSLPSGFVATKGGALMASSDTMRITVTGRGGHASEPFRTIDPIPVACEIVQALQAMVTRRIDVFDPGVITVARITAGTTEQCHPRNGRDCRHHSSRQRRDPPQVARRNRSGGRGRCRCARLSGRGRSRSGVCGYVERRRRRPVRPQRGRGSYRC